MRQFRRRRDKALKVMVALSLGMGAGSVIGGLVSTVFGWQQGVPVFVATFIVVVYGFLKGRPNE